MADIFLSYAREDIKKAEMLAIALESQGWSVFWDRTSLLAGQDFEAVIEQAIKQAGCMVVAWSEASRQSDWVRGEAGIARERNILVPILFELVEPPIAFRSLHTENLTGWDGEADAPDFLKLCKAINERITAQTAPSTSSKPSNPALNKAIESAKPNFLTRLFKTAWDWLSVTKHQQTLAFIGGVLSIVITGGWQTYLHFSNKPKEANPTIPISGNGSTNTGTMTAITANGGNATNIVGNNNTVGDPNASANIKEIVATLTSKHQLDSQAKDEQIRALTEAVTALSKGQGVLGTKAQVDEALLALANNDTTQAKALFAKATQKADQEAKEGAKAYRNLGALAYFDNTQEALAAYRRATELDPDNADGWNGLGYLLRRIGSWHDAVIAYDKVKELGEIHQDEYEISVAYGNLGNVYSSLGEKGKAFEYYQKALKIDEKLGWKEGMAHEYAHLGNFYRISGDLDKAADYLQKGLALGESLGLKDFMAFHYGHLGLVHESRFDLDKALNYYQKALALNEISGNKEYMAWNYIYLGNVHRLRDNSDIAQHYYQKALTLAEALNDKECMAMVYIKLGIIYETHENLRKAEEYYQQALKLNEWLDHKRGISMAYSNLGDVYITRGDLNKSQKYYQQALTIDENLGIKEAAAQDYADLGMVYEEQGHKEQSKQSYQKSIELFKALGNPTKVKKVQGWLDAL